MVFSLCGTLIALAQKSMLDNVNMSMSISCCLIFLLGYLAGYLKHPEVGEIGKMFAKTVVPKDGFQFFLTP